MHSYKLIFIITLLLFSHKPIAQNIEVFVGGNFHTLNFGNSSMMGGTDRFGDVDVLTPSNDQYTNSTSYKPGFQFGLTIKLPVFAKLSIEPGVQLITKGGKYYEKGRIDQEDPFSYHFDYELNYNYNLTYVEAPLLLNYGFEIGKSNIYIIAGGYYAYGISGKLMTNTKDYNIIWKSNSSAIAYHSISASRGIHRIDIGVSYGVAVQYKQFKARALYSNGLTNVFHTSKNNGMKVSLIYMLKKKPD